GAPVTKLRGSPVRIPAAARSAGLLLAKNGGSRRYEWHESTDERRLRRSRGPCASASAARCARAGPGKRARAASRRTRSVSPRLVAQEERSRRGDGARRVGAARPLAARRAAEEAPRRGSEPRRGIAAHRGASGTAVVPRLRVGGNRGGRHRGVL